MIRALYSPIVVQRVRDILNHCFTVYPQSQKPDKLERKRKALIMEMTGLHDKTVFAIAKEINDVPSGRIIASLGIEVLFRDKRTGKLELAELKERCDSDPKYHTMSLLSSKKSRENPWGESSGSE